MNTLRPIALVLGLLSAAGCASRPTEPDPTQPWLTLDEYKASLAAGTSYLVYPVVTIPPGAEVELQISRKAMEIIGEEVERHLLDSFEPVDDPMMRVRVRSRKTIYLDLNYFLASADKKSWMPMSSYFFPLCRVSKVTVKTNGSAPDVTVPVVAFFEQMTMIRDTLSDLKLK